MKEYLTESAFTLFATLIMLLALALLPYLTGEISYFVAIGEAFNFWQGPMLGFISFGLIVNPIVNYFKNNKQTENKL